MTNFILALASLSLSLYIAFLPTVMASHILARADDTCGDPATAQPFQEWYQSSAFQGTIALVWPTQEPEIVPLYYLHDLTTEDFIFLTPDSNGNLPTFPGATLGNPVFFVYPT
ncbi:hypothetical protein M422DRAFT_264061 [Sphaerobolus stellatus SS14]|uniref:Uncharacterized protein n=1 Tax=Sphaerobolus stellatus (strain SS14) TaxID=990650 RepID=A0A0C9TUB1_SPHS4|nr:hypothetical protein M422DRAFT_264061 [Sphaerobolus stellatus SS14]